MSNLIPPSYEPLVQLLEDNADGAHTNGAAIGLKQNTEPNIRANLGALTGTPAGPGGVPPAVPGLKNLWNTAKGDKVMATAAYRSAQSNGRALAMTCIGTLKPALGSQWNSAWNAAGFIGGSLAVPTNPLPKLQQLRGYYEKNPGREVANVNGVACTAAACETAAQAISTAESASNQSNTDAGTAQANYQAGITTARNRASGLLAELGQLLDANDPRWLAFGFEMPGHPSSPDVPQNLTVTAGAAGSQTLFFHWGDARRADGYRAVLTNAADGTVVATQLTQDAEATFDAVPTGVTLNATVSARNATGESQPSAPPVIVVVPPLTK